MRGGCVPYPIVAIAHPPRAPWEKAPSGPVKLVKQDNGESNDTVQGGAGEGCHCISCGTPRGLARRHDGGFPMKGDLSQDPGVTSRSGVN